MDDIIYFVFYGLDVAEEKGFEQQILTISKALHKGSLFPKSNVNLSSTEKQCVIFAERKLPSTISNFTSDFISFDEN